jgi:hypothetical protein
VLKVVSFIQLKIKKFLHRKRKKNRHKLILKRKEIHAKNLFEKTKKKKTHTHKKKNMDNAINKKNITQLKNCLLAKEVA